nr:topoisomerase IIA [Pithovirus mammoth]
MRARNYQKLSHEDHIRTISDTYIGSDKQVPREARLLTTIETPNGKKHSFVSTTISLPEAVEYLFLEIESNAGDNADRSYQQGVDPGPVTVMMNGTTIAVRNSGLPIPVEMHPEHKVYVPELIFGMLLTSSNYSGTRTGAGRNGYGAKLVNLYSKSFSIEVADPVRGILYKQSWQNLMNVRHEPILTHYEGPAYVTVYYDLDLARFGYSEYPQEAFGLFAAHVADLSLTSKIVTHFNDQTFSLSKIEDYSALFRNADASGKKPKMLIHRETTPFFYELCLIDTPDEASNVSFANTKLTRQGGTHITAVMKAMEGLIKIVNGEGKGKEAKDPKSARRKVTLKDLAPHLSIIINCRVENPGWSDQMKTGLKSPALKIALPEGLFKKMASWDLVARLFSTIESRELKALSSTDGKKRKHVNIHQLQDANFAGTKQSSDCSLYVVEGVSASGYAGGLADALEGRDYIGIYPIRGKLLNVMNANPMQIANNDVISRLKEVIGLREGLDYSIQKNFETLRYGHLIILADADVDGKHIIGLILNLFFCRFPTLLARGFVKYLRTPVLRLKKGKQTQSFFSDSEYLRWQAANPDYKTWEHKYCKGLGSSSEREVADDSKQPRVVVCFYDENAPTSMKLAFDEALTDLRKNWIEQFKNSVSEIFTVEGPEVQSVSDFINIEMVRFSLDNLSRSVPRMLDGLKVSQRKAIWGAMSHWKSWHSSKKLPTTKVKQLAGKVSGETAYKHGEDNIAKTIMAMAQVYVGTNNMPYFVRDGQFGSRKWLGEDTPDSRYPFTCPEKWWPYVFRKEDEPLLTYVEDEGQILEPVTLLPILPMCMINGCNGIGTGWSTFMPNHSPSEVADWLEKKILEQELPEINPWYMGFEGGIYLKPVRQEEVDDDDDHEGEVGYSMITSGIFHQKGDQVIITELPIGRGMQKYSEWLKTLVEAKIIKDYQDKSTLNVPQIIIEGFPKPTLRRLKLQRSFGMTNIVLLDTHDNPKRYPNTTCLLEDFYAQRLPYYEKRKANHLKELKEKFDKISHKIRLVLAVLSGEIVVSNRKKSEVVAQLEQKGIPKTLLKEVNLYHLTAEEVERLQREKDETEQAYQTYSQLPYQQIWLNELIEFKKFWAKFQVEKEEEQTQEDETSGKSRKGGKKAK